jgi:hypothetical protein
MRLNSIVGNNPGHEALETEIERQNYARAAQLAESLNLKNDEIEKLRYQALCQMAALYRNPHGTKALAQQYDYSKKEVKQILVEHAKQMREKGNSRPLKACYDCTTGKYLTFEEWINHCIDRWHKL